jgi:hypothetical protein
VNNKMLALYGLKWNPFAPAVTAAALHVSRLCCLSRPFSTARLMSL